MAAAKKVKMITECEEWNVDESVSDPAQKMTDKLTAIFRKLDVADEGDAKRDGSDRPSVPDPCDILQENRSRKCKITDHKSSLNLKSTLRQLFESDPDLQHLEFDKCKALTDAVLLETLPTSGLPLVTKLILRNCLGISDNSMELITRLIPNLRYLDLDHSRTLTDNSLLCISLRLRQLQHLNLTRCRQVTDKGIGYLAGHFNPDDAVILGLLQRLKGPVSHVANDNLASTNDHQGMTHSPISYLNLFGCQLVTDEALRHLSSVTELRSLDLTYCQKVSHVGIAHLVNLPRLSRLHLPFCHQIDNEGLAHLAQMPCLLELNLRGCPNITFVGLKTLANRKPKISSLDNSLNRSSLDYIAGGLLELRSLRLDHRHTTDASLESVRLKLPLLTDLQVRDDKSNWSKRPSPRTVVRKRSFYDMRSLLGDCYCSGLKKVEEMTVHTDAEND